ncbi:hypothetical protein QFZ71_006079 [Streptomyces sp. V2I9]|nr:hypothetical protein [Streptomyces sp. V2I9]
MAPTAFRRQTAPVNTPPPPTVPLLLSERDPRTRDFTLGHADMHAPVADLALPGDAPVYVMSAMETSRELLRYSSGCTRSAEVCAPALRASPDLCRLPARLPGL